MPLPRLVRRVLSLVLMLGPLLAQVSSADSTGMAVLVMSDNRSRDWTRTVRKLLRSAQLPCPYQIFFGNGDSQAQLAELRTYIRDLEDEGATNIVVVPLVASSASSSFKQWRYLLGLDVQPGYSNALFFPLKPRSSINFAEPLNDSAVVVEILLDRAQELSARRTEENIVIIAQGAADEAENNRYVQTLKNVAGRLQERGGYKSVVAFTLRDDGAPAVRQRAIQGLRARVEALSREGQRVLIVPLMLVSGGLEHRLSLELRGTSYVLNTKPLFPDTRIADWIRAQVP